ncbi:alkaline phosphatase family protein [Paraprevotella clara]|uniref:DUF4983 domain-containing protein n=1 Tax=Paraprevotella clara YIT 11840 TaxID=762968 RepID=G5SM70_9BACT|nr:hypothetical protein [Paraprevotella clara]EHH01628.1 hypothetical protein HMPREF9441_00443 [Paraprevotella clara YIT 11840]BDI74221.1 hypothetical protein PC1C4_09430 [Paraprevotella clara]
MNKIANKFRWLVWFMCGLCTACTVYDTPADIAGGSSEVSKKDDGVVRYVLWVNIDGARGTVVKEEIEKGNLPVLKQMLAHSKYAWMGLADDHALLSDNRGDFSEEDPVTWASMLTGVHSRMHRIKDYSYTPDYVMGASPVVPNTVVQYLSNNDPMLRMSCVTPWENLNHFVGLMQSVVTTASDDETVETLVGQLSHDDYRFTLAGFRSVLDAGKVGGFTASNAQYVNGLKQVDTGLGRLLAAIDAREDIANEDWLICVTSNHGGTEDGRYGGATDEERDIFGIFYYSHYTPFEMKGETVWGARFSNDVWAVAEDSTALYGIGSQRQLTMEIKMCNIVGDNQSYTGENWVRYMGKDNWGLHRQRNDVKIYISGNKVLEVGMNTFNDARWHSFYVGLGPLTDNGRMYIMSDDGKRLSYSETQAMGVENDSSALTIGHSSLNFYTATVRLWSTLLGDEYINECLSLWTLPENYSQREHLLAEWRFSPDELKNDSIIPNRVEGGPDFIFKSEPSFVKLANNLPDKLASGNLVMENTLVVPQIIYWLCGADAIDSKLDGYNFLSAYRTEEQWRDQ